MTTFDAKRTPVAILPDKRDQAYVERHRDYQRKLSWMISKGFTWYEESKKRDEDVTVIVRDMSKRDIETVLESASIEELAKFVRLLVDRMRDCGE